jgi:ketosteroid isomerase-like protein
MLYYLSEDAWPLAGVLGLVALGFLIALWVTQQGKYLFRAGIALGLAVLVLGIEHFWVTDNERIEAVVKDLRHAVEASDADRVIAHLAPEVSVVGGDDRVGRRLSALSHHFTVGMIRGVLDDTQFDYVRVSRLTTHAGAQSRLGTAEFRVQAMGSSSTHPTRNFATNGLDWSLGFRETSPGVWKVTRITPVNPPAGFHMPFGINTD